MRVGSTRVSLIDGPGPAGGAGAAELGCDDVAVRDNGPGIRADDGKRIFEPYAQARHGASQQQAQRAGDRRRARPLGANGSCFSCSDFVDGESANQIEISMSFSFVNSRVESLTVPLHLSDRYSNRPSAAKRAHATAVRARAGPSIDRALK